MYMMDLINGTTNSNETKAKVAKAIRSLTNTAMNESFKWHYDENTDKIVISVEDLPIMFYLDADTDLDEWN